MRYARSQLISLLLHLCAIALLLAIGAHLSGPPWLPPEERKVAVLFAPRHRMLHLGSRSTEPAGGGNRSPLRRGELPRAAHHTFILPPTRAVPDPQLIASSTIDMPDIRTSNGPPGAPDGLLAGAGLGPGRSGMGSGCCGGAGDRNGGDGLNGRSGQPTTPPLLIYRIDPEFSEEARKAKYGGTVLISIEIGTNGLPANMRVVSGLALGLNEKAMEAVAQWRFRPASRAGKPVASSAMVEVHFHLL